MRNGNLTRSRNSMLPLEGRPQFEERGVSRRNKLPLIHVPGEALLEEEQPQRGLVSEAVDPPAFEQRWRPHDIAQHLAWAFSDLDDHRWAADVAAVQMEAFYPCGEPCRRV